MDEKAAQGDTHLSSAAAFVEGGIQEACDDACSICLEEFCDSDPSTVTECKHEFHLQCILEWCQRSSQCPMCWQPISLKDPTSQELLEAVERERSSRSNRPRNTTIFHHPTLGDFELQHLPVDVSDAELEERILQHLAAAAAMGRSHLARRDGHRGRSRGHGRPQYMVFSTQPNVPPVASDGQAGGASEPTPVISITAANPSVPLTVVGEESTHPPSSTISNQILHAPAASSEPNASPANRNSPRQSTPVNQDRAGPSDFQSLSETLKSRFNAVSMKYKESITKSTRGWRERLFSRNTSVADIGSEVRREVNAGISSVSRMMEHLDTRENSRDASASHSQHEHSVATPNNQSDTIGHTGSIPADRTVPASSAAASSSS